MSLLGRRVISNDPVGAESRSGLIGVVVWVVWMGSQTLVFFFFWGGGGYRGGCSCILSDGRFVSCIVVDSLLPAWRGKYILFGDPCRLPRDLEWYEKDRGILIFRMVSCEMLGG